jgi:hypothetical protein
MFTIEILQGIGKPPIRLEASQVVIRMPDGTPVSVAALFGGSGGLMVSHCTDEQFNDNLQKLGITQTVITKKVQV